MNRNRLRITALTALLLALAAVLVPPTARAADETALTERDSSNVARVRVRCDHGETIARALTRSDRELDIVVSGTCNENVVVRRDLVTIRGANAAANINGSITVFGASNVTVADLKIANAENAGLIIQHNSGVIGRNLRIEDCARRGIFLEGSVATLRDISIDRIGNVGILNRASRVELLGTITVRNSGVAGISATDGSAVFYINPDLPDVAIITVEGNLLGYVTQLGSETTFAEGEIHAHNNSLAGVYIAGNSMFVHGLVTIDSTNNSGYGLWVDENSSFSPFVGFGAVVSLDNNAFDGAFVERGATLELTSATTANGNAGRGLAVDGGYLRLSGSTINSGNAGGDLALTWRSQAEFFSGNTLGSIACDSSVLVRGSAACTSISPLTNSTKSARDHEALRARVREALANL